MVRKDIEVAVAGALAELGAPEAQFVVERSGSYEHGDYATNAAFVAAKILKKNPLEFAQEIVSHLGTVSGVQKITPINGFINFRVAYDVLLNTVQEALGETWGENTLYKNKIVLIEYTSPNLFKPLHIGNLIGNIVGESLARLFEVSGAHVKRLNYPSDIGLTIAKGVWGLQKYNLDPNDIAQLGKAYVAGNEAYESGEAKEAIENINKALYEGSNSEWNSLREEGIKTSLYHLHTLCKRLGTENFDTEFFESQSGPVGQNIVQAHIGTIFEKSEGAVVYHGAHTRVFLNSQNLPTYEAKEVGLFKLKTGIYPAFDISITVTGKEQQDFFRIVFEVIQKIFPNQTAGKVLAHIPTSFLKLTTGKMSSRLGNVITGESLLADLTIVARGREDIAVGGIKYVVLKSGSTKDIIFDPEKSLSLEGDSGPYVQYALVRARAVLRKAAEAVAIDAESAGPSSLERLLVHFPEVVERAGSELEPHYVVTYITELAADFNSWYASERFIVDGKVSSRTIAVVKAIEHTLSRGLEVLGIPAPEEM